MEIIVDRKKVELEFGKETKVEFGRNVIAQNIRIEFECGENMLNKKINVTCNAGDKSPSWKSEHILSAFKSPLDVDISIGNLTWTATRLLITPLQDDNYPIAVTIKEVNWEEI